MNLLAPFLRGGKSMVILKPSKHLKALDLMSIKIFIFGGTGSCKESSFSK